MKLAFQLAFRNIIGSGLRTWLNVSVLSFAFVVIIFYNGLLDGWNAVAMGETIEWEVANGHLLNDKYAPYDPFSIQDGHARLDKKHQENLSPLFVAQGTIYPQGRLMPVVLKGIKPLQEFIKLPIAALLKSSAAIPVIIGKRMADAAKLKKGDNVLLRWRDKNGTFDASEITICEVFDTPLSTVDNGQIWFALDKLWEMTGQQGEITFCIANEHYQHIDIDGWRFESQEALLQHIVEIMKTEKISARILYGLLLAIALLAIFDTQVFSIFRRQKEIGTYIALGMTRPQVVALFTVEGAMYSLFATIVGSIYGAPIFYYFKKHGITFPQAGDIGVPVPETIFPVYSIPLILSTVVLVVVSATIVSFLPSRKISQMNPVDALKGKVQ